MKAKIFYLLIAISITAGLLGCAGSRIYLIDVKYIPEPKGSYSAIQPSKVVGICPFKDERKGKDKDTIGLRHRSRNYVDLLKVEEVSLSEAVTRAAQDYFVERGYKVTDCNAWDGSPEGLARFSKELSLVVGGKIESFTVEARSGLATTTTHYRVKLVAFIGEIEKGKVTIRTTESGPQTKQMRFNVEKTAGTLNRTLTEVIQNLFK